MPSRFGLFLKFLWRKVCDRVKILSLLKVNFHIYNGLAKVKSEHCLYGDTSQLFRLFSVLLLKGDHLLRQSGMVEKRYVSYLIFPPHLVAPL